MSLSRQKKGEPKLSRKVCNRRYYFAAEGTPLQQVSMEATCCTFLPLLRTVICFFMLFSFVHEDLLKEPALQLCTK